MEMKVNYTLVGLFVVSLSAAIMATLFWLLLGGEAKQYERYRVYISESVSGLNPKAVVRYRGVEVGRVASVALEENNPERVNITLEIEQGTPIREDTEAVLTTQGLTGLTSIELTGGSRDAQPLPIRQGEEMPVIRSGPSLVARLDNAFTSLAMQFDNLAKKLDVLLGAENQSLFTQTLTHLNSITEVAARMLSQDNQLALTQTLADLKTVTRAVAERTDVLSKGLDSAALTFANSARISTELTPLILRFNQSLTAIEKTAIDISKTSENLDIAVQESRRDLLQIANDTGPEIAALIMEFRQFTASMQRLGRELERNPRALVFGRRPGQPGPGE